jgi:hypothetical protein
MFGQIRSHLTYANVMVTILAFVVLGGGTALASYVVSSNSQVGPGTISGHKPPSGDHANIIGGSVSSADLASQAVTEPKLAASAVGARAYGLVTDHINPTVTRSKNVAGVTNPKQGIFCIALAGGINASKTGLVVTPDFTTDETSFNGDAQAMAEWVSDGAACPAGRLEVITGERRSSTSGSPDGDVHTDTLIPLGGQGFFFVVP